MKETTADERIRRVETMCQLLLDTSTAQQEAIESLQRRLEKLETLCHVLQSTVGSQTELLEKLSRILTRTGALPEQPPPPPSN